MVYKLKDPSGRETETAKTIFACIVKGDFLKKSKSIKPIVRLRWEPMGHNLKPTKYYIAAKCRITLKAGKPKVIVPASASS